MDETAKKYLDVSEFTKSSYEPYLETSPKAEVVTFEETKNSVIKGDYWEFEAVKNKSVAMRIKMDKTIMAEHFLQAMRNPMPKKEYGPIRGLGIYVIETGRVEKRFSGGASTKNVLRDIIVLGEDPRFQYYVIYYDALEDCLFAQLPYDFADQQLTDAVAAGYTQAAVVAKIAKVELAIMEGFLGAFSIIPPLVSLGGVLLKSYHYRKEVEAAIASVRVLLTTKKLLKAKYPSLHDYLFGKVAEEFWTNIPSAMSAEDYAFVIGRWAGAFSAFALGLKTIATAVINGFLPIVVKVGTSAPENFKLISKELATDMAQRAPEVCSSADCLQTAESIVTDMTNDPELRDSMESLAEKLKDLEVFSKVLDKFRS